MSLCREREDMEGWSPRAESGPSTGGLFVLQPHTGRMGRFIVVPRAGAGAGARRLHIRVKTEQSSGCGVGMFFIHSPSTC